MHNSLGLLLWIFLALFCFRVSAQLLQLLYPATFLPAFEHWQCGNLPYGWLLFSQVLIIYICARPALGIQRGSIAVNPALGKTLLYIGIVYFVVMALRLILGLSLRGTRVRSFILGHQGHGAPGSGLSFCGA